MAAQDTEFDPFFTLDEKIKGTVVDLGDNPFGGDEPLEESIKTQAPVEKPAQASVMSPGDAGNRQRDRVLTPEYVRQFTAEQPATSAEQAALTALNKEINKYKKAVPTENDTFLLKNRIELLLLRYQDPVTSRNFKNGFEKMKQVIIDDLSQFPELADIVEKVKNFQGNT